MTIYNRNKHLCISLLLLTALIYTGCGNSTFNGADDSLRSDSATEEIKPTSTSTTIASNKIPTTSEPDQEASHSYRDNTPQVLTPIADGITVYHNPTETASIDASHTEDGYVMVSYSGSNPKVKLQITGPDNITYTYDLNPGTYETFPLTSKDGSYTVAVYENVSSGKYSTTLSETLSVKINNEFAPFLYPNQYVDFNESTKAVALVAELTAQTESDLDAVSCIYNYIISHISYDTVKAENVQSGYLPNVDSTLHSGKGICFDYAAVMTAMLRSQGIPTRLEIGYAKDSYHAWISTYITDIGWINGIIEFDGKNWTLMDPTFAASSSEKALKKFIGDGSNYVTEYIY